MMRVINFISGFMIGMIIGSVTVLLTTPQSGSSLQSEARSRWENAVAEGKKAAAARRTELEARLATLKTG
jgi:gas vesicle protein